MGLWGSSAPIQDITKRGHARRRVDLYAILGVDKCASPSQLTKAYRSLALRYHPDRNMGPDAAEAAEKFKEISTAYAILSDPNKKRKYDMCGKDAESLWETEIEAYDVENLNSLSRVWCAFATAVGAPILTQIGPTTLLTAEDICKEGRIKADDKRVALLPLGQGISNTTSKQQGAFYKLTLTDAEAANGVILSCSSPNKSRFKLVLFEADGGVRYVQESAPTADKASTTAAMFLVPFETITSFGVELPTFSSDPAVFSRLNTMTVESRSIHGGEHLVCVYGDNWLQSTSYSLTAVLAELDPKTVAQVKDCDERIRRKRKDLEALQEEYSLAKERLDRLKARAEEEAQQTEALLAEHEAARNAFIGQSLARHTQGRITDGDGGDTAAAGLSCSSSGSMRATVAAVDAELCTSGSAAPLSEHGKDDKAASVVGPAAAGALPASSTMSKGKGKRSFFTNFFQPKAAK